MAAEQGDSVMVEAIVEGGASLTILSGIVAGNFSAFWLGTAITVLMGIAYWATRTDRSLGRRRLALLFTFPFTLLSCEAFADHRIEFSLGEFLLLCCLTALISDFRRVLCLIRGGRHLGGWRGVNFR